MAFGSAGIHSGTQHIFSLFFLSSFSFTYFYFFFLPFFALLSLRYTLMKSKYSRTGKELELPSSILHHLPGIYIDGEIWYVSFHIIFFLYLFSSYFFFFFPSHLFVSLDFNLFSFRFGRGQYSSSSVFVQVDHDLNFDWNNLRY